MSPGTGTFSPPESGLLRMTLPLYLKALDGDVYDLFPRPRSYIVRQFYSALSGGVATYE
jgi:hypothetical protein